MVNQMTMEERISGLVDKVNRKLSSRDDIKEEVKDLKKSVNIIVDDQAFSFRFENAEVVDFKCEALETADITLSASEENMNKLLDGELRPMKAYITRKITLKGNIQDIMFLKKFL